MLEGQIFKLFLDVMHTDALGKRGINLKRFSSDPHTLFRLGDIMQRPHVVQSVGQLDQQHANVFGHR